MRYLLWLHILNGAFALLAGAIAIVSPKGKNLHRKAGTIYFITMCIVVVSAIVLALAKQNYFLFSIALFSFYLAYSGYRSIQRRMQQTDLWTWYDKLVLAVVFTISWYMLYRGIFANQVILLVFGMICFVVCMLDLRRLNTKKPVSDRSKVIAHISKMCGAYIATFTAFLVNNVTFEPAIMIWLLPTVIGAPLITFTAFKWAKKLPA